MEPTVMTVEFAGVPQAPPGLEASVVPVSVAGLSVGYSPRQTKVDPEHVSALADVLDRLPPVVVDERTMTVIDGVHRLEAYRSVGRSHIPALLFRGSDMDALVIAVQANLRQGRPLSRSERQEAARVLLGRWPERSDRWVGEVCGVSHTTVAVLRRSVNAAGAKVRTGRDGRRRPVDPARGRAAVARVMAENPTASIREAAGAAGVAPSTVQRVAAGLARSHNPPSAPVVLDIRGEAHGPVAGMTADRACNSFPVGTEAVSWLARTAVSVEDLHDHLRSLPLSRLYEVADECRQRARAWALMADALEGRARRETMTT